MKDILEEIIAWKRLEVSQAKERQAPSALYHHVESLMESGTERRSMRAALATSNSGIIAEFKRKSPSKGWIHEEVTPKEVVPLYDANGASALSILTDEKFFGGNMAFVSQVRPLVKAPILRKDFIIDEYQLFEAKAIGADAVLLIAAALSINTVSSLTRCAHELGLDVLLELHAQRELDYATCDADMLGVNNRNLGTFHTDIENSFRMATMLPHDRIWVSESGISSPDSIRALRMAGYRGFLIGETFMKAEHPGKALKQFIEAL